MSSFQDDLFDDHTARKGVDTWKSGRDDGWNSFRLFLTVSRQSFSIFSGISVPFALHVPQSHDNCVPRTKTAATSQLIARCAPPFSSRGLDASVFPFFRDGFWPEAASPLCTCALDLQPWPPPSALTTDHPLLLPFEASLSSPSNNTSPLLARSDRRTIRAYPGLFPFHGTTVRSSSHSP